MGELDEYRKKRNFDKTDEPSGENAAASGDRLKFAVQYHIARRTHYDFRLEWDGALLSWAVPKGPSYDTSDKRLAVKVEDHPLDYADFEGLIPKGEYGGGTVMLWDEGFWTPLCDVSEGLKSGSLKFEVAGKRIKGKWALVRLKDDEKNWLLIKENDKFAADGDGISQFVTSVKTGRTTEEINAEEDLTATRNPFDSVDVQLARLADEAPDGDEWLFEVKYDGYRVVAFAEGGNTRLSSRNHHDITEKFKPIADAVTALAKGRAAVLDGEVIIADKDGKSDFQALQSYIKKPDGKNPIYMIFDLLALDGEDLRGLPLSERKERLSEFLKDAPKNLKPSGHIAGNGSQNVEAAREAGLEGVVGKKAGSLYRGDRGGDWIKIKCRKSQEFVIAGYTMSDKKIDGISALLLGYFENKKLKYVGRAGTGIGCREARDLKLKFEKLQTSNRPFETAPKFKSGENIFWLQPKLVAEIEFAEITSENLLRQASYKGLRTDKTAEEVVMEKAENTRKREAEKGDAICGIKITSPDKIVFKDPEIKKIDVIRYYERVSERMLAYAGNRLLSVVRCHKGVSKTDCFFKKHPESKNDEIISVPIANSEGEEKEYFYVNSQKGLVLQAQLGTLEFHVWGSRVETLEKPDMMVFDLDPDEGMPLEKVRLGVKDLKSVLDELALESFLKTSGGKGYHIVVPFAPVVGWDVFDGFAKHIAEVMQTRWPDRYTSNQRKNRREDKIFIDWMRNGRGATSVAPYSLRARPGARVSMPIFWEELDTVAPDGVDILKALERIESPDPWRDFYSARQKLKI